MKLQYRLICRLAIVCLTTLLAVACGKKDDDDDAEIDTGSGLPKINSVNLSDLGAKSANLAGGRCPQAESMGIFGLALGGACSTLPLADGILLGSTEIGDNFSCDADYDPNSQSHGIMIHLLCHDAIKDNTTSFAFENKDEQVVSGVSFKSFGSGNAKGSWSPNGKDSYPADIRVFRGRQATAASMQGLFALELADINTGRIQVDMAESDELDHPIHAKIDIAYRSSDAGKCPSEPSDQNCHVQEVSLYTGDESIEGNIPNGFHLKVFADDKSSPRFLAGQGAYTYSAESAASLAADAGFSNLADLRTIRFEFVQKDDQIWGRFDFQDAAGETLTGLGSAFKTLAAIDGICHNLGESEATLCVDIDPEDYQNLWSKNFEEIEESPVADGIFENNIPTKIGIQTN